MWRVVLGCAVAPPEHNPDRGVGIGEPHLVGRRPVRVCGGE